MPMQCIRLDPAQLLAALAKPVELIPSLRQLPCWVPVAPPRPADAGLLKSQLVKLGILRATQTISAIWNLYIAD
jgi:hypothetical protein